MLIVVVVVVVVVVTNSCCLEQDCGCLIWECVRYVKNPFLSIVEVSVSSQLLVQFDCCC